MSLEMPVITLVSVNQRVALNQAIMLLERSNSDHAEQCVYHLKKLRDAIREAKGGDV